MSLSLDPEVAEALAPMADATPLAAVGDVVARRAIADRIRVLKSI
jgi:hypothetical protein